jgi:branched-chain amino acid transport system ATP-binding protein
MPRCLSVCSTSPIRWMPTGARPSVGSSRSSSRAPVIIQRIGEVLQTLKQRGMTILLVEQNFRFASKVADRFYVVDHGQVIDTFDVADLPGRMSMLNEALGV